MINFITTKNTVKLNPGITTVINFSMHDIRSHVVIPDDTNCKHVVHVRNTIFPISTYENEIEIHTTNIINGISKAFDIADELQQEETLVLLIENIDLYISFKCAQSIIHSLTDLIKIKKNIYVVVSACSFEFVKLGDCINAETGKCYTLNTDDNYTEFTKLLDYPIPIK